jgi:hypothetical protein
MQIIIYIQKWLCVLGTRQRVGVAHAFRVVRAAPEQNREPHYEVSFDVPHHPRRNDKARMSRRLTEEL